MVHSMSSGRVMARLEDVDAISGAGASATSRETTPSFASTVADSLRDGRLRETLAGLNARTRFRYTGIYRVEDGVLRNLALFDRENPAMNLSGDVCALNETYCAMVSATDSAFVTRNSLNDPRLSAHPARLRVVSYAGVPIKHSSGARGTLCHFDCRPRLLAPGEIQILESIAPMFAELLCS